VRVSGAAAQASARAALSAWLPDAASCLAPLGAGHINDTWLVTAGRDRFVLQRINPAVFPEPEQVMAKVAAVVAHLHRGGVPVPALIPTGAGAAWCRHGGSVWRLWQYVAGSRTRQILTRTAQARAAGAAFGALQRALADYPDAVPDPIPGFMQLGRYLDALDQVCSAHPPVGDVAAALRRIDRRRGLAGRFATRDRLVHGDCKVNNLLFHAREPRVVAVIDLDTVMRGHWAWDFGDLVRSATAGPRGFSLSRYAAVVEGFLHGAGLEAADHAAAEATAQVDPEALVLAPRYVTLMLAVRFLTDHLAGDRYFKVAARGDNLRRAEEQLALLADMEAREPAMRRVVARA
jgi:Ser/Thr protein kinase RdoA (MazF antagonist)